MMIVCGKCSISNIECLEWYEKKKSELDSVRELIYTTSSFWNNLSSGMTQGQMGVRCFRCDIILAAERSAKSPSSSQSMPEGGP